MCALLSLFLFKIEFKNPNSPFALVDNKKRTASRHTAQQCEPTRAPVVVSNKWMLTMNSKLQQLWSQHCGHNPSGCTDTCRSSQLECDCPVSQHFPPCVQLLQVCFSLFPPPSNSWPQTSDAYLIFQFPALDFKSNCLLFFKYPQPSCLASSRFQPCWWYT